MRVSRSVVLLFFLLLVVHSVAAQSPNGTISGIVLDPSGGAIPGASVFVINSATGVAYPGKANSEGYYVVPNLPPGIYRIQVSNLGFKTIIKPDIVVHVEDALAINFTLPVGAASELVTVEGGAPVVNTTDAAVSTVVDRNFVENIPLNGRSFQDLILLTPGVLTDTPQAQTSVGTKGEFSVNGQRTESNYYTVDGVSANTAASIAGLYFPSASGAIPAATALGTTQAIVSVDALQEFRVESSTYSAEFGRYPGGQFSFVTRSGTNEWHGSLFEYLRNDVFDANDWFNNYYGQPEPALRQSDFGGTLGGPVRIPHIYNGKDKTFFFFSYEGLRLVQPQPSTVSYVPDQALRQATASNMQSIVNAFPIPNGPDLGDGVAEFIGTWSSPSHIDTYSFRLDHAVGEKLKLFFRFGDTESASERRDTRGSPAFIGTFSSDSRTYTFGAISLLGASLSNDLRLNFTQTASGTQSRMDDYGGAQVVDFRQMAGLPANGNFGVTLSFTGGQFSSFSLDTSPGTQRQWNLVDVFALNHGAHTTKWGFDWRRLTPTAISPANLFYLLFAPMDLTSGNVSILSPVNYAPNYAVYTNFSSFVQDEWHKTKKLTLSFGLRWDINPPPGASNGVLPRTVEGVIPTTLSLAPQGTSLWNTQWSNFAPRLGAAYVLRSDPSYETVLRAGVGVFYDTGGQQVGGLAFQGPGSLATAQLGSLFGAPVTFPAQASQVIPPIVQPTGPLDPYTDVWGYERNLQTPYTWQSNVSLQQALGRSQSVTVSSVGGFGRKLIQQSQIQISSSPQLCVAPCYLFLVKNGLTADYNSLQTKFQRALSHGLNVLASYTWSHSIDYGSTNLEIPYVRGNSDFDVRQNFSAALSYDSPGRFESHLATVILGHWGLDDRFMARSGFPVTINGAQIYDPATEQFESVGLDLVPGQPAYVYGLQCAAVYDNGRGCPGGRAINPNAFALPADCSTPVTCSSSTPGTAPRNFARGLGAWQMDLAIRREFPIHENMKLQFRAEAFNIFNHPNFGALNSNYCSPLKTSPVYQPDCTFGQATQTLANSLATLSPLYQMGGPRSIQFALKMIF